MYSLIVFLIYNNYESSQMSSKSELIKLRFFENKNKMMDFFMKLYGIDKLNTNSETNAINQFKFFINNHMNIGFSEKKLTSNQSYIFVFGDESIQNHDFKNIISKYYDPIPFSSNKGIEKLF